MHRIIIRNYFYTNNILFARICQIYFLCIYLCLLSYNYIIILHLLLLSLLYTFITIILLIRFKFLMNFMSILSILDGGMDNWDYLITC